VLKGGFIFFVGVLHLVSQQQQITNIDWRQGPGPSPKEKEQGLSRFPLFFCVLKPFCAVEVNMLRKNTFVKKSRKNKVVLVDREHYLGDDIWCGVEDCTTCKHDNPPLSANQQQFLIVDTNVVLHQIDFIEHPKLTHVIILETVLQEVKHRNMHFYTRLRETIDNSKKHFFVFVNEFHMYAHHTFFEIVATPLNIHMCTIYQGDTHRATRARVPQRSQR
jgi:hypothetical protein